MPHYSYSNDKVIIETSFPEVPGFGVQIPANGLILNEPLIQKKGYIWVFQDGKPKLLVDKRGTYFSKKTGNQVEFTELGDLPNNLTPIAPSSPFDKWNGNEWIKDEQAERTALIADAVSKKDSLMDEAFKRIEILSDIIDLDGYDNSQDDTSVKQLKTAWRRYRVALSKIDQQKGFPVNIVWPEPPEQLKN